MKLTVLGSGSCVSDSKRATSGFLIESGSGKIVLDLGFGCFKNLQKAANPLDVSALFFSHFSHADHVADLIAFLMHRKVSVMRGAMPNQLNLFGPIGFNEFFANLLKAFPSFQQLFFPIKTTELDYNKLTIFNFDVRTKPVKHSGDNAVGFRIDFDGKAIAYSGDTEYCDAIVDLGKNSDLLILECSAIDEAKAKAAGHLSPESCARIAKEANAKSLMLSHLYPETESLDFKKIVSKDFSGEIIVAKDLLKVKI